MGGRGSGGARRGRVGFEAGDALEGPPEPVAAPSGLYPPGVRHAELTRPQIYLGGGGISCHPVSKSLVRPELHAPIDSTNIIP